MARDGSRPDDQFDTNTVINIEAHFYDQGFTDGSKDGVLMGKAEGRSVGFKTGFEKFLESGRIAGKTIVWANRYEASSSSRSHTHTTPSVIQQDTPQQLKTCTLPPLASAGSRLRKNLETLYALVEPGTLSTRNSDEAVDDFDDRLRRAQGKMKVVERMVGEGPAEK